MKQAEVFEDIYRNYLAQVADLDLNRIKDRLGIEVKNQTAIISFFGKIYRISPEGIVDEQGERPSHSVSVILCQYLLLCPEKDPVETEWVTYKDFKDAGPFAAGFSINAEKLISRTFSSRLSQLADLAGSLTGRPARVEVSCDLALQFQALPKIPLLLLFNDRDEDFPADCSLLFQKMAEDYLDMECLAIAGMALASWLKAKAA